MDKFISRLKEKDIKMVAFDMDCTLTTQHSRGVIPKSESKKYTSGMTNTVKELLPLLLKNNIAIGVATKSDTTYYTMFDKKDHLAGEDLIITLLSTILTSKELSQVIKIGLNPDIYVEDTSLYEKHLEDWKVDKNTPLKGEKSTHLNILAQITGFKTDQILLIDDEKPNILSAVDEGYRGIHIKRIGLQGSDLL
jgi:HAD superfamily phosphatase (TIGR01681 family)